MWMKCRLPALFQRVWKKNCINLWGFTKHSVPFLLLPTVVSFKGLSVISFVLRSSKLCCFGLHSIEIVVYYSRSVYSFIYESSYDFRLGQWCRLSPEVHSQLGLILSRLLIRHQLWHCKICYSPHCYNKERIFVFFC